MHLLDAAAWCSDCQWKTEGKNAMGNAAQHHQKTGHFTWRYKMDPYINLCFGILARAKKDNASMWRKFRKTDLYKRGKRGNLVALEISWWVVNYIKREYDIQ